MKKNKLTFIFILLCFLAVLGRCVKWKGISFRPREDLIILITSNMEGNVLNLPHNNYGKGNQFYTIPTLMSFAKKIRDEYEKKGIPVILIDGGNTFFGSDDFSLFFKGKVVSHLLDYAGYELVMPAWWEYQFGVENISTGRFKFLRGNTLGNFGVSVYKKRIGDKSIAIFGYFQPRTSPIGVEELYRNYNFDKDIGNLESKIKNTNASVKILLCRCNDLKKVAKAVPSANIIVPLRFYDKKNVKGFKNITPHIDSKYAGIMAIGVELRGNKFRRFKVKFLSPSENKPLPSFLDKYIERFEKQYGNKYPKVNTAFLGYGDPRLTHNLRLIQETPTAMAVADMIRDFSNTDITLINLFSIRKPIGGIIRGEYVEWVLPFANKLVLMDLTGEQIETIMRINQKRSTGFMIISGAQVTYDHKGIPHLYIKGKPIEKKRIYRVSTNDYLASSKKLEYAIFRQGRNIFKTHVPINAIFLDYLIRYKYIPMPCERIGKMGLEEILKSPLPQDEIIKNLCKWGYYREAYQKITQEKHISPKSAKTLFEIYLRYGLLGRALKVMGESSPLYPSLGISKYLKDKDAKGSLLFYGLYEFRKGNTKKAWNVWKVAYKNYPSDIRLHRLVQIKESKKICGPPLWRKFKGNNKNNGRSPYKGVVKGVGVLWSFKTYHSNKSSPAIGQDGTIYFGGGDGFFYALSPKGDLKWKYEVGGYILSSPAISNDGTIYFGGTPLGGTPKRQSFKGNSKNKTKAIGFIYALNPDGTLKWKYKTHGWVASSPAIDKKGRIIVGCNDHFIYAINSDGTLAWKFETEDKVLSSPAIDSHGNIYIGSEDFYIYSLTPSGKLRWKFKAENKFFSSPAIDDADNIYIGNDDSHLYAFDNKGNLLWKRKFPAPVTSTPSIYKDGSILVGCEDGFLYHLTPDGKNVIWKFKGDGEFFSSPIIDSVGNIYIGCEDNFLYAISKKGKLLWKFETGDYIESTPVISPEGNIYLCAEDKKFYCLGRVKH